MPWEESRCLVWDATCVSTFAASHLSRTTQAARSAAKWAATQKEAKYAPLRTAYIFVPFFVEDGSAWGTAAIDFVRAMRRRLKVIGSDPRAVSYVPDTTHLAGH